MADIHGVISSVLDLLPVARDGFSVMKEILSADRSMDTQFGRLEIQQQMFDEWRALWRDESRFKSFAKEHPPSARRMLKQVAILIQALSDATALERRFGFSKTDRPRQLEEDVSLFRFDDLSRDIMDTFRARAKANLSFIQKSRFIPVRKRDAQLNDLIELIKECNLNLRDLSLPLDAGILMRSDLNPLDGMSHSALKRLASAASWESKHTDDPAESERYHDLALAGQFTGILKFEQAKPVFRFGPRDVHVDSSYELGKHETMALLFDYPLKGEKRVVLIEWVKDGGRPERRKEVYDLALILAASKPGTMLLASCYGVIEDPAYGRVGLVLSPPPHIRSGLPKMLPPGTVSALRMPVSLRDLIIRKHTGGGEVMDLAIRFKIAQRLLDAAHVMHATTWVHRNIRPDSIIFFPARERSKAGIVGPSLSNPQIYALDQPLLVGFNHIRSSGTPKAEFTSNIGYNRHQYSVQIVKREINPMDAYQHPDRILEPAGKYRNYHDLYSVGCVLLELGYWDTIDRLLAVHSGLADPVAVSDHLRVFALGLDGMMGSTYGRVARELLDLADVHRDFDTSKMETKLAATLSQCSA